MQSLVNGASSGIGLARFAPEKRVEYASATHSGHSFAVNASGAMLVAKHFRRFLTCRARCVFANCSARVGSIEDNRAGGWFAYRASKAAQNMITSWPHGVCMVSARWTRRSASTSIGRAGRVRLRQHRDQRGETARFRCALFLASIEIVLRTLTEASR